MVLLVIDVQKALVCEQLFEKDAFVQRVARLVEEARKNFVEVIYFQHDAGPGSGLSKGDEGFEIVDEVAPRSGEKAYIKTINSCFGNTEFVKYLKQSGEKELVVAGLQTEFCIDATIKSAFERGYKVFVPHGANTTFDNEYLKAKKTISYYNEWIWPGAFAACISMDEALDFLRQGSGQTFNVRK